MSPSWRNKMKVSLYAILIEDSHSDTDVEIWLDKNLAIARAWELAQELDHHGDIEEQPIEGWTLHLMYGAENYITVLEKPVKGIPDVGIQESAS
jgi:hypothetical protein